MKIIQILISPTESIFGLGDDGLMYFWIPETQEWHIYG